MDQITRKAIELNKGPAGRAIAQPMEESLIHALYEHITLERSASAQYLALSLWFAERELRGFAKFFEKESREEMEHASSFCKYVVARGQTVVLDQLEKPNQDYVSIQDIISETFQMEVDVTTSLQQIYSMAERSNDARTTVFLDPVIEDQIKSEDYFAYLIGKVKFANENSSSILIIDNELSSIN
ncbi:ferritin [Prochlorococcus sp. MIT 1223]|uniref:ferritin n=1 Tax=Prochlorococcus sp. MIT 1223 TaxID=3096217 RepID=UPI002A752B98|nr:ferritin [Prochlorococcus sp. MIT 1223]